MIFTDRPRLTRRHKGRSILTRSTRADPTILAGDAPRGVCSAMSAERANQALIPLVRLLARQAAREAVTREEKPHGDNSADEANVEDPAE